MNRSTYTVLLADGTAGLLDTGSLDGQHPVNFIGEIVRVKRLDENGFLSEADGTLTEVLELTT